MYKCMHIYVHAYLLQHVDLSNINALCLGGGTRCSGRVRVPYFTSDPATSYENVKLVGWLCLTSHRQRGHLETAPPFTVPCEGREAR